MGRLIVAKEVGGERLIGAKEVEVERLIGVKEVEDHCPVMEVGV